MTATVWVPELRFGIAKLSEVVVVKRTAKMVWTDGKRLPGGIGGYQYIRKVYAHDAVCDTKDAAVGRLIALIKMDMDQTLRRLHVLKSELGTVQSLSQRTPPKHVTKEGE